MKIQDISRKNIAIIICIILLLSSIGLYYLTRSKKEVVPPYAPSKELPKNFIALVEAPSNQDDMMFISSLSSITVRNEGYNPLFILDEGSLDSHQLWTIDHMEDKYKNAPKILFTNNDATYENVKGQVNDVIRYNVTDTILSTFKGFSGVIDVASHEEALWVSPIAKVENKVIRLGRATFADQEMAWGRLKELGINANYIVMANPNDISIEALAAASEFYDPYDDNFHTPALSCLASQLAAFHNGFVLTQMTPSTEQIYTFNNPNYDDTNYHLNARSTGYYKELKKLSANYYVQKMDSTQPEDFADTPEYVCIVGSSAAIPQFQIPGNGDGDNLVNVDVMFGFLDDDLYHMDAAVARFINLNIQGASNQLVRTLAYDSIVDTVSVEYSDGPRNVDWRRHGASFSGYEITYERMQVSPGRFICKDYTDEGLEYEYYGPAMVEQEVTLSPETTLEPAVQASAFVAYRGHGSDTGALYMASYVVGNEEAVLRGTEARDLFIPPQVAFWVSCMNGKIHGTDFGADADDVVYDELFSLNYLYGGAVALGGATEVSYSNIGQDLYSYPEEYLPGIINPAWSDGNHEWNRNDAWYAFFWDGMLNFEKTHGSIGKALQWAENRYIDYQTGRGMPVTPFESSMTGGGDGDTGEDPAVHWKEVAMFVIYGDPAFTPASYKPGSNNYNPWSNGDT